ncbi:flavodoxin domain-containing protein [Pseudoalteromonas aurantia]|uniref:Flavodoxin n=1 Tax=Pseudoalteromonas aurantia TaxID=43654 RepID=A0A5S3V2K1_9GAMM|nr:flavodoxin domain-containing protein [Pseudoalteromonas aurantia]TMO65031.1 flavodoxin [Pseudoalteromonas aurantia]
MAVVSIFVGSMYGNADNLAAEVKKSLVAQGHEAEVFDSGALKQVEQADNILFVSSTTGAGDIPDNLEPLITQMQSKSPMLTGKKVGVIALGDRSYGETFCGAGKHIEQVVKELNATVLKPRLDVDAGEYFEPWEPVEPWLKSWQQGL